MGHAAMQLQASRAVYLQYLILSRISGPPRLIHAFPGPPSRCLFDSAIRAPQH